MACRDKNWPVFLVIASGVFLSTLDSSMVNIALPAIMAEFQAPLHKTEWVVMAYLLTISSTLLFWGHISDRLGRGRFYGLGFLIFGLGAAGCAFAVSLNMLISARFSQALGAAMMMANGPAIIRQTVAPEKLGRSMGLIGVPVSLGLMCGPVAGGFLIEFFSWRALFLLSLPLSLVFAILSRSLLPPPPPLQQGGKKYDWPGAALWSLLLFTVSLSLTHWLAADISWKFTGAVIGGFLATLALFVKIESRSAEPVLPLFLLKKRFFTIGVTSALLSFLILFFVLILIPFYLDLVLHLPPSRIGLVMMTIPLSAMLVAPVAGWLSDFSGARLLSTLGLALSTLGLLLLSALGPETSPPAVAARLALLGIGQAIFLSPNSASVLGRMGSKNSGTAAALLATARNLGMMLGVALAGLSFSFFFRKITGGLELKQYAAGLEGHFCQALSSSFLLAAVAGTCAVILSWQRPVFNRQSRSGADVDE
ncbi:MAG: MFS transporter [Deltaproteobacteria bacterium]|nr:MFS transporter [Deltaproteobacteria bacterium]